MTGLLPRHSTVADGPLFGMSAGDRGSLARSTAKFGHLPIIATYYNGLPAGDAWTDGPGGMNKSAVVVSFKALPSRVLSGAADAALSHFFDTAPGGAAIYFSYYAEPERAIRDGTFTASQYRAAWTHIAMLAGRVHNRDLKSTLILRASDLGRHSGLKWKRYLPAGHIIKAVGWEVRGSGSLAPPARLFGSTVSASRSVGLPFGIVGFAAADAKGRPRWLKEVANYLMRRGALFGVLSSSPLPHGTELRDHASITAWRAVVASSGTHDPLPLGPPTALAASGASTLTPSPSSPTSASKAGAAAAPVCGQAVLKSPFSYNGAAGPYSSGTPGLPTYGTPGSDFPTDTRGVVLPPQTRDYENWMLRPNTVYYLEPGTHVGSFAANTNDAFVGGYSASRGTILSGNYSGRAWAIDSNSSMGDQRHVSIEYLTIEKYQPPVDQAALNQDGNTGWHIQYNTITLNVPGGGAFAATNSVLRDNCMTLNGQYGFQAAAAIKTDSLTTGPYNLIIEGNEISFNDTCDLSGLITNPSVGWENHNPVPKKYRNAKCGKVSGDGNQGGFKLWETNGVTIKNNYIHHNWGPGGWADTNNANTTWTGNRITDNESAAIIEETSYNFAITNNYIARNDWIDGLGNPSFPQPAIYISESGSVTRFGGVPACGEAPCARQPSYPSRSVISGNTLVNNGGNIFLWQNSNRSCTDGSDHACTLVGGGRLFGISSCAANLPTASIDYTTYRGRVTGSPARDWWDGCQWQTSNVSITNNVIDFDPAYIPHCDKTVWPDCGAGGIFSEYGAPNNAPGWAVATQLTFFSNDAWRNNIYNGPSTFFAWNQGNGDNPVSWANWSGDIGRGDRCTSPGERQSGYCTGPYGQDGGSTFVAKPVATAG